MHISQIADKSANNLITQDLDKDTYHMAISQAAQALVKDNQGHLTYGGQWNNGATFWLGRAGGSVRVENGKIE